jgi:hypothetical protein
MDSAAHKAPGSALYLRPVLGGMVDTRDFDILSFDLVYDDEG